MEKEPTDMNQPISNDFTHMTDVYSNTCEISVNPWDASISFGKRATKEGESNQFDTRVMMPLQQAKVIGLLMMRTIRQYEERSGTPIELPSEILAELGIGPEDWRSFTG